MAEIIKSFQDYTLIETYVNKYLQDYGEKYKFTEQSMAFLFFVLERIFNLQEDESYISITDTNFITRQNDYKKTDFPHDKGIDSIVIDEENKIVHILNFKYYKNGFDKIKNKSFESSEIPKIKDILKDIFERTIPENANPILKERIKEIFLLQDKNIRFTFQVHFISNLYKGFTEDEERVFKSSLYDDYQNNVEINYILIPQISEKLIEKNETINGRFRIEGKNFFEKSEYGYRALIFEMSAKDLIRITSNDEELRNNLDAEDSEIQNSEINENSFEDNVRIYLKQRSNINKNIKNTALDEDESSKFFYFNNGVTITCNEINYLGKSNFPVELLGLQVVNGSQTIHSLKEAFEESMEGFEDISLLCRVYETKDPIFKSKVAEYTNNQNPVTNRDVRSIDIIQIKLEKELQAYGFYYERKKNQYETKSKAKRIDSEKFAQAYLAYYLNMPGEAKNKKSIIFSNKYSEIFNDLLTAEDVLFIFNLYQDIENKKFELKKDKPYLTHATYYIMYFIKILNKDKKSKGFISLYNEALNDIEHIRDKEKNILGDDFSDAVLFRGNTPKTYLSELGRSIDE
ncbi:MAG: AIPR family protein [Flavobacteriaceae bacterium]|nr:AIPR family protein [Flavobacteriaceae bacterium]